MSGKQYRSQHTRHMWFHRMGDRKPAGDSGKGDTIWEWIIKTAALIIFIIFLLMKK